MSDYTPPQATLANLNFFGIYTPGSTNLNFEPDVSALQTLLFQIWTDENYVYCATKDGLGVIPLT